MKKAAPKDLSNLSMIELFRLETDAQAGILTSGLLELERAPGSPQQLETLMRAAHSLKGAARIVNLPVAVHLAHAMEDCFVAAQQQKLLLRKTEVDILFNAVDLLLNLARRADGPGNAEEPEINNRISHVVSCLKNLLTHPLVPPEAASLEMSAKVSSAPGRPSGAVMRATVPAERVVRLTAENLNRLLGLAGESLVESRWLRPFADSFQRLKRHHTDLGHQLDVLRQVLEDEHVHGKTEAQMNDLFGKVQECHQFLSQRMEELDLFDRRSAHLSHRLYLEVLRTRMRPFADGTRRFPRMVRDLAQSLGKEVRLEISGETTQVDRDLLERLETPLAHLLRNAVDHGCEISEVRKQAGKPAEAVLRLEARHSAGMLLVTVSDDGAGVDLEKVRQAVIKRKLAMPGVAERLSENQLLDFLMLPGFTVKEIVTEISGRGVGLDVVQNMIKSVRGQLRLSTQAGRGMKAQLQLPLTLSVLRALLVEVAGEPYAIPLSQISRTLKLSRDQVQTLEGRPHFQVAGRSVGLLSSRQLFEIADTKPSSSDLSVVIIGDRSNLYGVIVDRFLGEKELVVHPLDARLGKVRDISAAALMEDGSPVLIVDVDEMIQTIEQMVKNGRLAHLHEQVFQSPPPRQKKILIADDSLTIRELERKLLQSRGYQAEPAVDGMDAWNAIRSGNYDLVITDVDMPRLSGIELAALIKKDLQLKSIPVLIVSYKESESDKLRGMEAGADYYLSKGSFDDQALVQAVADLIGEGTA